VVFTSGYFLVNSDIASIVSFQTFLSSSCHVQTVKASKSKIKSLGFNQYFQTAKL
jgi:hypothetical protein